MWVRFRQLVYEMSFTNVGKVLPLLVSEADKCGRGFAILLWNELHKCGRGFAKKKTKQNKLVGEFLLNGDRKGGRDFASFVLWNVPFIDLRELNKCGRDFASLLFCFVLFLWLECSIQ